MNHSEPIDLGRQGENLARTIDIDISAWRAEYGEGTVQLLHQRPGDSTPYPAAVEQAGDVVRWAITSADTARVGYGAAQLLFFAAGDVLAKQCIYRTYVSPSLGQSAGEPPEAQQPWVERVLAEAAKVTGMTARAVELPAGADPTADYADGILTIGIPLGGEVSEAQVAQAVADYLAAHPIKESDPTVPDWAKQPNKPSYSADEVGAIAQTELQAAVDTALAQAKASGAFDGAPGSQGEQGPQGKTGVGIQSVEQTTTSTEDGGTNIVTVTKTDGTSSTFQVKNGSKGSTGPAGADGKSAYAYAVDGGYTGTEEEFAAKLAADYIPAPATAEVGQTIVVKAVDESGKPTEWAAADMPGGGGASEWTEIGEITLDGTEFIISAYSDGVVTIAPENGIYPQVNKSTVLRKSDYSSYINVRFIATGTEGQYTMKNLDGAVYAPSDDLTQYVVDVPSADSISFSNIPEFLFFKAKITTPLLCVHGVRISFINSYDPFDIVGGDCTGLSGGAAELVLETEDSPIAGKIYSKGSFKGKSASRQNGYDVIRMFDRPTAPANITFAHYNGLLTIGTKVKLWGRN